MDAGDLAVFEAVARAGGITRAAAALNTVQSNVTQRVRLLEAELGVPLFHRHSRGVSLTSAGAQLLPYAERIGRLLVEARQAAADNAEPKGRIVLGALETATALRLPPVLAAYAAACPAVDIEIGTGTSAELVEAVLTRRLEAAFVAAPVHHADLVSTPLASEELVLVTAPWIGDLSALAQAAGEALKIIVFRPGCSYRAQLEALLASRGLLGLRRLEFGTLDGIIGCVAAGIGLTLLPRIVVARAAAEGRVALHALPPKLARVDTLLVHRADAFVSVALQRFFDIARDVLAAGAAGQAGSRAPRRVAPAAKSRSRASSRSMAPPANSSRKSPVKSRA